MSAKAFALIGTLSFFLMGCGAIPADQLAKAAKASGGGTATCPDWQNLVDLDPNLKKPLPGAEPHAADAPTVGRNKQFSFMLPGTRQLGVGKTSLPGAAPGQEVKTFTTHVRTFQDMQNALKDRYNNSDLPAEVKASPVTVSIFNALVQGVAQAQIDWADAHGYNVDKDSRDQVKAVTIDDISLSDLKDFSKTTKDKMSHPTIGKNSAVLPGASGSGSSSSPNVFIQYFKDYYEGNFYDRFGNNVSKPSITPTGSGLSYSITIPDAAIASALTVTLEYLADLIDPTPVMGDTDLPDDGKFPDGAKFYPGKAAFTHEPEALKAGLAPYKNIKNNNCGVTTDNAVVLYDAANAAGDAASSVSGLVSQSWGGWGFAVGAYLKFSIGDNQTLATIVKTAADRVAQRLSLAASYWALDAIGDEMPRPGAALTNDQKISPAVRYLKL